MPQTVLFLGPVAFEDFEVASGVSFGGSQRLAVHDLPGSGRVIDALGDDEGRITVQGVISGDTATSRARLLTALRAAGDALPMTWDVFYYTVVVQSFQAEFRSPWWIPFRLVCAVLRDEATVFTQAVVSLGASVLGDIASAAGFAPAGVGFADAQAAAALPDAAIRGTVDYGASLAALSATTAAVQSDRARTETGLNTTALFGPGTAADGASALAAATAVSGRLSELATTGAYAGRALANLRLASS